MYIKFVFIVTFFTHSADYIAAQSFEEYVCKFCNQHATTGEANARFGRGLNESALHEIVMKELQRVMSNESAFRQAVRKEVDAGKSNGDWTFPIGDAWARGYRFQD